MASQINLKPERIRHAKSYQILLALILTDVIVEASIKELRSNPLCGVIFIKKIRK